MKKTVNGHFLFTLKKGARPGWRFFLAPATIFSRFLFPLTYSNATQAINILNYFTGTPKQWEDVFLLLRYTGVQLIFFFFFSKNNHALIALWENRIIKYFFLFNRGYVVLISAQPLPEIEEFSLTFKALDLKVLLASHWFRMSGKRNRIKIR